MTMEEAEIPGGRTGNESLPVITRQNRGIYFAVVVFLGAVLLIGVVGWLALAAYGKTMPDGLGVILGTVAGALVAMVTDNAKK
jgi:hypothetical protein